MHGPADSRRQRELEILNEVAAALNRSADLGGVLESVLARVAELLGLDTGWIWLLDEDDSGRSWLAASRNLPPGLAQRERMDTQGCWCLDAYRRGTLQQTESTPVISCSRLARLSAADTGGLQFHVSVPLVSDGRRLGLMNVAGVGEDGLGPDDLRLLHTVGDLLSIAIERSRLYENSLRTGAVEERYRLARELHDTLGQGLAAVLMRLETLDAMLSAPQMPVQTPEMVSDLTQELMKLTRANLEDARRAVLDLRAVDLEGRTLAQALEVMAASSSTDLTPVRVHVKGARPLPVRIEAGLYRIAQEAVRNAIEHGSPGSVDVHLTLTATAAVVRIEDDGCGFDPQAGAGARWGLRGIGERARLLGGEATIASTPGQGTRLTVHLPLVPENDLPEVEA